MRHHASTSATVTTATPPAPWALHARWKATLLALAALVSGPALAAPGDLRLLDDGRIANRPFSMPEQRVNAYLQAFGAYERAEAFVSPRGEACEPRLIGVAPGSFTRPDSAQLAFLYSYCEEYGGAGSTRRYQAVAVMEGSRVVRNVDLVRSGAQGSALTALRDIDRNGLSELLLQDGGAWMGEEYSQLQIVELTTTGARILKVLDGSGGTCSSGHHGAREQVFVYFVRPGPKLALFVDTYQRPCVQGAANTLPYRLVSARKAVK